jgi:hypothetical protein
MGQQEQNGEPQGSHACFQPEYPFELQQTLKLTCTGANQDWCHPPPSLNKMPDKARSRKPVKKLAPTHLYPRSAVLLQAYSLSNWCYYPLMNPLHPPSSYSISRPMKRRYTNPGQAWTDESKFSPLKSETSLVPAALNHRRRWFVQPSFTSSGNTNAGFPTFPPRNKRQTLNMKTIRRGIELQGFLMSRFSKRHLGDSIRPLKHPPKSRDETFDILELAS